MAILLAHDGYLNYLPMMDIYIACPWSLSISACPWGISIWHIHGGYLYCLPWWLYFLLVMVIYIVCPWWLYCLSWGFSALLATHEGYLHCMPPMRDICIVCHPWRISALQPPMRDICIACHPWVISVLLATHEGYLHCLPLMKDICIACPHDDPHITCFK